MARVLDEAIAYRDGADVMSDQPAQVSHLLAKLPFRGIWIGGGRHQERVAAPDAYVFVAAVPIDQPLVSVMAKEAAERVSNVSRLSGLGKIARSTSAPACAGRRLREEVIVDVMAPERA